MTDMSSTQKHAADTQEDRRDNTAPRRRYEALVEVGSASVGGFEAESVDLCLDGMRLRTAYLPKAGEELVCRFDGHGGEIVARGEVVWTDRNGRAGECGLRFVGLDRKGMKLLEDLCEAELGEEPAAPEPEPEPEPEPLATPGSRVRLHISGLGSPMRARVRDSAVEEVLVGSNLEFLKVGRVLDLEDVERGRRRQATIEHVGVDIDPESHVPQLVVALSYADEEEPDLTTAPIRVRKVARVAAPKDKVVEETTPEPTVIDNEPTPSLGRASVSEVPAERVARIPEPAPAAVEASDDVVDDEDDDLHGYRAQGVEDDDEDEAIEAAAAPAGWLRAASAFAERLKPTLSTAQSGARSAVGKVAAAVQQRRAKPAGPKRTTAPPPGGGLRSQGRRVVRDPKGRLRRQHRDEVEVEDQAPAPKGDKRRALFSAVLGVMAVFAIYFASQKIKGAGEETPGADPASATSAEAEVPGGASAPPSGVAPGQNPVASAQVPLFGATPMSTTEAVPVPPQFAKPGELPAEDPAAEDEGAEAEPAKSYGALETDWGVGEITNPTVLRLKMDGKVEGIVGKETATGFTVVVPGRKSVSNAAGLARKDKRLTSVNVVNYPDRAEITLRFRKDVPAFLAKVQGKRLIIHISTPPKKRRR